jgi:hypothetical protein
MNLLQINEEIIKKVKDIDAIRAEIRSRGEAKAESIKNYRKTLAVVLIRLKNGDTFELDGNKITKPPVTYLKDVAKGICYQEMFDMEVADSNYWSASTNLEACQAQLMALQSVNKHLDSI